MNEATVFCTCCGEALNRASGSGGVEAEYCPNCYRELYTTCADCGEEIHRDNAYLSNHDDRYLCWHCYEDEERSNVIRSYNYRPDFIFHGEGERFYGVELEIDEGGQDNVNAKELLAVANGKAENLYIKADGSLSDGLELVTHPMTLAYHQTQMPWAEVLRLAVSMGYTSHLSQTCGLHIHVNRDGLGADSAEQEETIARILYLVESWWPELLQFSRRTQRQLEKWASRYGRKDSPKEVLDHAKKGYGNRYTCVNLTNSETIEFRIFRGTLKLNTVIATLQLVNELCEVAISLSDEDCCALSWSRFMATLEAEQYPELVTYLKERRLYINDAVNGEEEV